MSQRSRIASQPGFLLHSRPFRDSSQLIEIFSRDHGRIGLVARGVRSARSRYRGILRPFAPLELSWTIAGDLGTLTGVEAAGRLPDLSGDALMAGFYVNELVLKLTHRHDAQPDVYAAYEAAVTGLAGRPDVEFTLRCFELRLLRAIGYGLDLEHDMVTGLPVEEGAWYRVKAAEGVARVTADGPDASLYSGAELRDIAAERLEDPALLRRARRILQMALEHCLEGRELSSRRVMRAMRRRSEAGDGETR
ncbi:DNA repair protein RecO [Lentisalinibacter salinarum]|uniref:DNA repair protein RecO n=1 Tax=Lentisalinibacter salinarum TaxID=2992239 RepID=UPI0038705243